MRKALRISLIVFLSLLIVGTGVLAIFINRIVGIDKNVQFDKEKLLLVNAEVMFYDNENNVASEKYNNKNTVSLSEVPQYVQEAFISIEDKNFYKHHGLNYKRMVKAMWNNMWHGAFVEGASTISQQLIKNTHLSSEKTIKRKMKEIMLTRKLEREFPKEDILEIYLNVIYFGEGAYGISDAASTYFNKKTSDLTLAEGAMLAGMIKAPSRYSPIYNPENCIERRNLVLREMLKDEVISQEMYDNAIAEELVLDMPEKKADDSLYYRACMAEAGEILDLSQKDIALSGMKIYTYLDKDKQSKLEEIVNDDNYYQENRNGNIADSLAIVVDNETYGIQAFAGRSPYNLINFNRQPGSAIKPILVYAPALDSGQINPESPILDEETDFDGYVPHNVGGFHGYVSASEAVALSLNVPAVKVLEEYGIDKAKAFAKRAGVRFDEKDTGLAIALGGFTQGITLQELVDTYLPYSNGGNYKKTSFIRKIVDNSGHVIYDNSQPPKQIMGEDSAYLMTDMLIDGVLTGTSKKLSTLPYQVAGKTGTVMVPNTNDNSDAVSVAYTTEHTMGVWLGNYSNDSEYNLINTNNGGTFATAMIRDMFKDMYQDEKPKDFEVPESVVEVNVDLNEISENHTLCIASDKTPERYKKKCYFAKRFLPETESKVYINLELPDFDVSINGDKADITFTAKRYLSYKVYRLEDGKEKLIGVVADVEGEQTVKDIGLSPNTRYKYYVEIISSEKTVRTDYVTILTDYQEKKYEKIIDQQIENNSSNSSNWFFMSR